MGALGLPQSAWQNRVTYAATAFPSNANNGDRIYRTDLGDSGGIWFTYTDISGSGLWVPDALGDSVSVSATAVATVSTAVSFGHTFPLPPSVFTNVNLAGGTYARWQTRAINITTTGFSVYAFSSDGAVGTFVGMPVNWIAIPY